MVTRETQHPREQIERAARMYHSSIEAAAALGMAAGSFGRLCKHYGIDTPAVRRQRLREEARTT